MARSRYWSSASLVLLTLVLVFHLVAMFTPNWKVYHHRMIAEQTMTVGIFERCDQETIRVGNLTFNRVVCYPNTYYTQFGSLCNFDSYQLSLDDSQSICKTNTNRCPCTYSAYARGLQACTITALIVFGLTWLIVVSHLFINEFKYRIHFLLSILTIILLIIGFLALLAGLILFGVTIRFDLHQYRYNLDYRIYEQIESVENQERIRQNVSSTAENDYQTRLDWSGVLEIFAIILSLFTLINEIVYSISILKNRNG